VSTLPTPGPPIAPVPVEPAPPRGGCARGVLIGCAAAVLLVLAILAAFIVYSRRRPEVLTDLMMGQVERNFAPDVTPAERDRLRAAYSAFRATLRERLYDREPLERLRGVLSMSSARGISRERVRELTEIFEAAAHPRPAAPAGSLTPSPAFSPTP
jgi:hypothetical protein